MYVYFLVASVSMIATESSEEQSSTMINCVVFVCLSFDTFEGFQHESALVVGENNRTNQRIG